MCLVECFTSCLVFLLPENKQPSENAGRVSDTAWTSLPVVKPTMLALCSSAIHFTVLSSYCTSPRSYKSLLFAVMVDCTSAQQTISACSSTKLKGSIPQVNYRDEQANVICLSGITTLSDNITGKWDDEIACYLLVLKARVGNTVETSKRKMHFANIQPKTPISSRQDLSFRWPAGICVLMASSLLSTSSLIFFNSYKCIHKLTTQMNVSHTSQAK